MTDGHAAAWKRLQQASLYHAAKLYAESHHARNPRQVSVPEVIKDNCEILGRGTEADVKTRLHWYTVFYPTVFNASRQA